MVMIEVYRPNREQTTLIYHASVSNAFQDTISKGPVPFPTIVVLGQKVSSNVASIVQFFCADSESGIRFALRSLFWREIDLKSWPTRPL